MPVTLMSRGVRCGIVSIPVARSIAIDAMNELMRARFFVVSLTSTNPTAPVEADACGEVDHRLGVGAGRRVELHRDDPLAGVERLLEPRLRRRRRRG